jgi:hypothetical protein
MRLALICAAAALATASLGAAAEPAPTASSQKAAKPAKTRKVCRRDNSTGSVIPKRVCRTVVDSAEQAKADAPPAPSTQPGREASAAE